MTMPIDLPSRTLLTSLFNSIGSLQSSLATTSIAPTPSAYPNPNARPNPLRALPPQSRNLFLTAHCLLPATFLAALDLLEKELVVRYTVLPNGASSPREKLEAPGEKPFKEEEGEDEEGSEGSEDKENQGNLPHPPPSPATNNTNNKSNTPSVYYIRSSPPPPQNLTIPGPAFTASASTSTSKSTSKSYIYEVRPHAWNCTCIAFTLAAYQRHTLLHTQNKGYGYDGPDADIANVGGGDGMEDGDLGALGMPGMLDLGEGTGEREIWYGGLSTLNPGASGGRRGVGEGTVPVCKHLLAAVLAERCGGLFGGYVVEKVVGVEEMAEMAVLWD
ncbi:hypothetical protein ABW19_dt0206779 [Dactylella cylindrospora]|nr:hypothetical protein ABW19_dt0206779 [Dactylella cylindrospora]